MTATTGLRLDSWWARFADEVQALLADMTPPALLILGVARVLALGRGPRDSGNYSHARDSHRRLVPGPKAPKQPRESDRIVLIT